jgi:hypothetical protein
VVLAHDPEKAQQFRNETHAKLEGNEAPSESPDTTPPGHEYGNRQMAR